LAHPGTDGQDGKEHHHFLGKKAGHRLASSGQIVPPGTKNLPLCLRQIRQSLEALSFDMKFLT
jgi:hypothetical protein